MTRQQLSEKLAKLKTEWPVGRHVDLYHRHWITQDWDIVGKVAITSYAAVRDAIIHHLTTRPHWDGECLMYAPREVLDDVVTDQ